MTDMFRVLLTGSRSWKPDTRTTSGDTLPDMLDRTAVAAAHAGFAGLLLVHGACQRGADSIGDWWVRDRKRRGWPVDVERYPADWASHGRRAGFARNTAMVQLGADVCMAFIVPCVDAKCRRPRPHGSHGASHCVELAEAAGIHVQRFTPDVSPELVTPAGVPLPRLPEEATHV